MPVETRFADYHTHRPTVFPAPNWLHALLLPTFPVATLARAWGGRQREQLRVVFRDSAVDYHRVNIAENYSDVLARFLLARKK